MNERQQLRKELLQRAQQLKQKVQHMTSRIEDDPKRYPTDTAKGGGDRKRPHPSQQPRPGSAAQPPMQRSNQPFYPADNADFRLADYSDAVKKCKAILATLKKHSSAQPFLQAVDPILLNIPDYFNIIRKPMDLGTVSKKLDQHHLHYNTAQDFAEDVRLIWHNCKLYNGQNHGLSQIANELEQLFESKFQAVLDRYGKVGAAGSESYAKRYKPDTGPDRSLDRPMDYEEKQQLGQLIGQLDNAYSSQVFDLIQSSCPSALDDTSDEVELDIEKLDARTARKLEQFVKSVINKNRNNGV
jgi:hypothetical protein